VSAEAKLSDVEDSSAVAQADSLRFPKWLRLALAVLFGIGAAFAFIVYLANGMVGGDLVGLPGRELDIAIAQHRSSIGLLFFVLLQFGVAGALFSYMAGENGRSPGRVFWAVLVSLAVTLACGVAVSLGLRAFH
jgi:hypothetical protein